MARRPQLCHHFTPEQFEPVGRQLHTMYQQYRLARLDFLYRCGELVAAGFEAASERFPQPTSIIDQERFAYHLATIAGISTTEIYACWRTVVHWDRRTYDEICRHPSITVRHLVQIALIEDASHRRKVLECVRTENWSPEDLARAIQARRKIRGETI